MKSIIFCIIFLFSNFVLSKITDGQFDIKNHDTNILVIPKKDFHLNAEAPAQMIIDNLEAIFKPEKKSEQLFIFKSLTKAKKAKIKFYICDDKKTVCEMQNVDYQFEQDVNTKSNSNVFNDSKKEDIQKVLFKNKSVKKNSVEKKLFIFSAPWCPACIRMKTEVFSKDDIKKELSHIKLKYINIDLPENFELSEKYHVQAIPTVILVDQTESELHRWIDYQPHKQFLTSLKEKIKDANENKELLMNEAKIGNFDAIKKLAFAEYNSLNCKEAVRWFSLLKGKEVLNFKLASEVMCLDAEADQNDIQKYKEVYEKAILLTTSELDKIRWYADYVDKEKEQKNSNINKSEINKYILKLNEAILDQKKTNMLFASSTIGEMTGFEKAEIHLMLMRYYEFLEDSNNKKASQDQLINFIKNKKLSLDKPGEILLSISYLREANEIELVNKLYLELIKKYPDTYVYYEKYARFLLKQKKLEFAEHYADLAIKFNEGNLPQLYLLKIRILKEAGQIDKTKTFLKEAFKLDNINHTKYKKVFSQLQKIQQELK